MKKVFHYLKILFFVLVIVFIVRYTIRHYDSIVSIFEKLDIGTIFLALLLLTISKQMLALNMRNTLMFFDVGLPLKRCYVIYNLTQLAKYIPGSVFQFLGRVGIYRKIGIQDRDIPNTLLIEVGILLASAFLIGIVLVLVLNFNMLLSVFASYRNVLLLITICLFAAFAGLIIYMLIRGRNLSLRRFLRKKLVLITITNAVGVWVLIGASFVVIMSGFITDSMTAGVFIYLIGLFSLAYAIGFCVPFAPAGIGIREGVIVVGISHLTTIEVAVMVASMHRILYFIVDLLLGGSAFILSKCSNDETNT